MHHDVPFSSQYTDLGHHQWRARGCGITALKMVLDFYGTAVALEELLNVGLEIGAYHQGIGWTHAGLVQIARRYGLDGFNVDWAESGPTPKTAEDAWEALAKELEHGPVMASMYAGLDPERSGGHIVVVTGCADGLVQFNDPEQMTEREGRRVLALETFLKAFKRRYIIVRPVAGTAAE